MPLADDQRAWLDQALRTKGRFVRASAVRKEFDNYKRRRDKTAVAWAGIPSNHPDYQTIKNGVEAADADAEKGKFSDAYKKLSAIKDLAKSAVEGRSDGLHDANMRMSLKVLESQVNATVLEVDGCYNRDAPLTQRINTLPQCSEADSFENGLKVLRQLDALIPTLRGDVATLTNDFSAASNNVRARAIDDTISRLETDLAALNATGRGAIADKYKGGLETLKKTYLGTGGRYTNPTDLYTRGQELLLESERAIAAARSFGDLVDSQAPSVTDDEKTEQVRSGLKPLPQDVQQRLALKESERKEARVQEYFRQRNSDSYALLDNSTGLVGVTPVPEKYNFDTVFGGLLPDTETIPDDVPANLENLLTASAVKKITDGMTADDVSEDVLLNMSVRCAAEFEEMAREQLFPGKKQNEISDSQNKLCENLGKAMEKEVCELSPNKMASDNSEIKIGTINYQFVKELKSGANGTARLFRNPNPPNETVVVKSMMDSLRMADMSYEIETHYRASQGASDDDSNIVDFKGAARSDDGGLHMVMEAVDGGDLEDMTGAMGAMESLGLLPPAAKQAIAVENLRKLVEAMKELEAQGLVHHDLKPENVMFTSDGKVKIIDFGESDFVGDDGVAHPDRRLGDTPGYRAPERFDDTFTQKFDTYALAGFLQKLIGGSSPEGNEIDMSPSSSLGRLMKALKNPDPSKRPSLDAVLATTIMNSAEEDHGPEAMENLTSASTEFAELASGLTLTVDRQTLEDGIGPQNAGFFDGQPPKLAKSQQLMGFMDQDITKEMDLIQKDPDYGHKTGKAKLDSLLKQKQFLKTQIIDKIIQDQLDKGETEYDDAMKSDETNVRFDLGEGPKAVTPKGAATLVERYQTNIENLRRQAFTLLDDPVKKASEIEKELEGINQKLSDLDTYRTRVETALKDALGSAAKLFLAKQKLNEATVNFEGGKRADVEVDSNPDEIEEDPTDGLSLDKQVKQLYDTHDNKEELAEEIEREATT